MERRLVGSVQPVGPEGLGVTTAIWGPLVWKILHAVLAAAKPMHAKRVCRLFTALSEAMPCKFCRDSLRVFLWEMREETGADIDRHVAEGRQEVWGYLLHEKVNDKLDAQAFRDAAIRVGVGEKTAEIWGSMKLFRGKRISFECMQRRLRTQERFGLLAGIVFQSLQLFALQLGPVAPVPMQRLSAFVEYVRALADALECIFPKEVVISLQSVASLLGKIHGSTIADRDVFALLWAARRQHEPSKTFKSNDRMRAACEKDYGAITLARSKACMRGTCA